MPLDSPLVTRHSLLHRYLMKCPIRIEPSSTALRLQTKKKAFTLFEVLIALAVFALAVAGIIIALDSIVQGALEARQRVLSRLELASRLAYNMVDPPLSGDRTVTSPQGITTTESLTPEDLKDGQDHVITGVYRLKISSQYGTSTDSAEILLYHPQQNVP